MPFKPKQEQVPEAPKQGRPFILKEFDKDFLTTAYFGFSPIKTPEITKEDLQKQKQLRDPLLETNHLKEHHPFTFDLTEKSALFRTYLEWKWDTMPSPIMVAYKKPLVSGEGKKGNTMIGLEIMGLFQSSAEALLIRTAISILEDEGYKDLVVVLNSLGDRESLADYERALATYIRKNAHTMDASLKKEIKKDPFFLVRTTEEKYQKFRDEVPKSMSFLSEPSRTHFKEVIEYIESFGIPYSLNPYLIGSPTLCSHTIFEIRSGDNPETVLTHGYWYGKLSKKIGFKREVPSMGATLSFKKKEKIKIVKGLPRPKLCLIQLGLSAKMKALETIEILRKAKIFLNHSLAKDKMQSQISTAENMKIPHILLIGQKEALEQSVVIRDVNTRAQESVLIKDLIGHLKKLKV